MAIDINIDNDSTVHTNQVNNKINEESIINKSASLEIEGDDFSWSDDFMEVSNETCEKNPNISSTISEHNFKNIKENNENVIFKNTHDCIYTDLSTSNKEELIKVGSDSLTKKIDLETSFYVSRFINKAIDKNQDNYLISSLKPLKPTVLDKHMDDLSFKNSNLLSMQSSSPSYDDVKLFSLNKNIKPTKNETYHTEIKPCSDALSTNTNDGEYEHRPLISSQTISLIRDGITAGRASEEEEQEWTTLISSDPKEKYNDQIVPDIDNSSKSSTFSDYPQISDQSDAHTKNCTSTDTLATIGGIETKKDLVKLVPSPQVAENDYSPLEIVAHPLRPQCNLAFSPEGQIYKIDLMASRPEVFKGKEDIFMWDCATWLNSTNGRGHIQKGIFHSKSFKKDKEAAYKSLLAKEKNNVNKWVENSNPFLLHDILFIEKDYKFFMLDRLIKQSIFTHPKLVDFCLNEFDNRDISKINIMRCFQILEALKKVAESFCCEGIPSKSKNQFIKLKTILKTQIGDAECSIGKEIFNYRTNFGCPERTFKWIFQRGAPDFSSKTRKRKSAKSSTNHKDTIEKGCKSHLSEKTILNPTSEQDLEDESKSTSEHSFLSKFQNNPLWIKIQEIRSKIIAFLKFHPDWREIPHPRKRVLRKLILIFFRYPKKVKRKQKRKQPSQRQTDPLTNKENSQLSTDHSKTPSSCQDQGFIPITIAANNPQHSHSQLSPSSSCSSPRLIICLSPEVPEQIS